MAAKHQPLRPGDYKANVTADHQRAMRRRYWLQAALAMCIPWLLTALGWWMSAH